ncbi:MAG: glycosyl transferase family 4 [Candidatus Pacearchaeota archaeon]|nr:glycosyl transferase family 4 [Candidatus Pacearchaeota archaeon]
MEKLLILPLLISFFIVLFFTPIWIRKAKKIGLIWEDMNKLKHPKNVAGSGGLIVLLGFVLGVLSYIAIKTFIIKTDILTFEIFALLTTIIIAGIIGFVDDIFGWVRGGLPMKIRIILLIFASIPLVVINAGESTMIGIEFGLFYPLIFIPIGIVGATTTFNFLAGYNGLETSQGILILSSLAVVTWFTGNSWLSLICLIMIACLCSFYLFNHYPAKVFPGDALTYSIGALIAIIAILGNLEKIAVFFFIPYILETILKLRGNLKKESFAKVKEDGSLENRYNKFYGLEHVAVHILGKTKKKVREQDVVYLINLFQVIIIIIGLIIFRTNIFA